MLVYILDPLTLEYSDVLEEFETCLWVERFLDPGETKIVMPANHTNAARLRPGTLLLQEDSEEPMLIETRDIKDGTITAQGYTLEKFFNERAVDNWSYTGVPEDMLRDLVTNMQTRLNGALGIYNLRAQVMNGEGAGDPRYPKEDSGGPGVFAQVHDLLIKIAQKYALGMYVKRLLKADGSGMELVFGVRQLNVRSDSGDAANYLLLSPNNDTFYNVDELFSYADWVDYVLVHPPVWATAAGQVAETWVPEVVGYDGTLGGDSDVFVFPEGDQSFTYRIREIDGEDITVDYLNAHHDITFPAWADMTADQQSITLRAALVAKGENAFSANLNNRKMVYDGEIPDKALVYATDYHLGDVVSVEGNISGGGETVMIAEYVRVSDQQGPRGYPSLSAPPAGASWQVQGTSSGPT